MNLDTIDCNFKKSNLINYIKPFLEIREQNPILLNNTGGMGLNQQFILFYCLKIIKPKFVIESGVWRGATTLLIEKSVNNVKLFCFDLLMPSICHKIYYESKNAEYITDGNSRKFIDFSNYDWSILNDNEKKNTFIIFDDHQSHYKRINDCIKHKFNNTYIFFDDNYIEFSGDCLTLKKMINDNQYKLFLDSNIIYYYELYPLLIIYEDLLIFTLNNSTKKNLINLNNLKKICKTPIFESIELLNSKLNISLNKDDFYHKSYDTNIKSNFKNLKKILNYELDAVIGSLNIKLKPNKKLFPFTFPCIIKLK